MAECDVRKIIKILSWNIDGLCGNGILGRTLAVHDVIVKENPDVVFLQEVIPPTLSLLRQKLTTYDFKEASDEGYFTVIMLKKDIVDVKNSKIIPFTNSSMDRTLQKVECTIMGVDVLFMTSHLESMKDNSDERKHQLKRAFHHMVNSSPSKTVVFGGDLNLRDRELRDLKGLPEGVVDLWQATGSKKEYEFTWDMTINTNMEWVKTVKFKPQLRFDRLFLRHSKPQSKVIPRLFELTGLEKIPDLDLFPSDHWGLVVTLEVKETNEKTL